MSLLLVLPVWPRMPDSKPKPETVAELEDSNMCATRIQVFNSGVDPIFWTNSAGTLPGSLDQWLHQFPVQDHEEIEKSGEKGHPMILNDFEYPAVFFFGV